MTSVVVSVFDLWVENTKLKILNNFYKLLLLNALLDVY